MNKKGVILYRVSTDQQDFLLQKNKNREYCKSNNIEIVGEYTEFDVSGYKTQLKDRTELLKVLSRAEEDKDFDCFIIYNFDRIIRREDEAPFVLSHLAKHDITCIETMSGEHIKNEDMTDKLMNYIRFWQAEYESVKTSQRVTDAIRAKNENNQCYKNINNFENRMDEDIDNMDIYIKGIRRNEKRIEDINEELDKLNEQLNQNQKDNYNYQAIYDNYKDYYNDFVSGNLEKQKLILNQMVEKIVFKNNGIKIVLKTAIQDSLVDKNTMYSRLNSCGYGVLNTQEYTIGILCANFNDYKEVSNG